ELRHLARATRAEPEYVRAAAELVARFVRAKRFDLTEESPDENGSLATPATVMEMGKWRLPSWVHAVVPLRFSKGDARYLLLGPRDGGRRYLSEDLVVLSRLGASVVEQVEQLRGIQMQNLMSQAELRALQAQINPH